MPKVYSRCTVGVHQVHMKAAAVELNLSDHNLGDASVIF